MQWPIPQFPTNAAVGSNVSVNATSANSKGAWTTLVTGLSASASWINLGPEPLSTTTGDRAILFDLAIGASGSETIVAADLLFGFRAYRSLLLPLHLPAGATLRGRISCALSGFNGLFTRTTAFYGEPEAGLSTPSRITTYGAVPASSSGTAVTPGASTNTMGSYTELTSATTAPIHALMVLVQSSTTTIASAREYLIDIAVGASGSETVIVPTFQVGYTDPFIYTRSPEFMPLSMCLPAGVRLSARCSANVSSMSAIEVAVYGFTY